MLGPEATLGLRVFFLSSIVENELARDAERLATEQKSFKNGGGSGTV